MYVYTYVCMYVCVYIDIYRRRRVRFFREQSRRALLCFRAQAQRCFRKLVLVYAALVSTSVRGLQVLVASASIAEASTMLYSALLSFTLLNLSAAARQPRMLSRLHY
jgi:hypothetical protein